MTFDGKRTAWLVATGLVIGAFAIVLIANGNPANMGLCVACFMRDTAGGLGLHSAAATQYLRPEIAGFILGSFIFAIATKRFNPVGGSASMARFVTAFFVMIGALVFLGCPLRILQRLAAGDLNALVGLLGFAFGIGIGSFFIKRGFSFGAQREQSKTNGLVIPALAVVLLLLIIAEPSFIKSSLEGPGSKHAPIILAFALAIIIGALGSKSSMCMSGGIRDLILLRNPTLFLGYVAIFVAAFAGVMIIGTFNLGFENQPIAHTDGVWNFLGLALTGFGSILLGGCPFRQTIMSGEGNSDAGAALLGFLLAAAVAHNFGIAASAKGVPMNGQIAVGIGFAVMFAIAFFGIRKQSA